MKHPKVQIYKHFDATPSADGVSDDEWGWRLIAANGEEVASGEGHGSPHDAERAFRGVCRIILEMVASLWGFADPASAIPVEVIEDNGGSH
jgi:hypothetical protein